MSIKLLDFHSVAKESEFIPQAVIDRPVSFFERMRKMEFIEGHDDLDTYQATALMLNGHQLVALMHYRGHPENTVTVYLPRSSPAEAIPEIVNHLVRELDLPADSVSWQRADGPDL